MIRAQMCENCGWWQPDKLTRQRKSLRGECLDHAGPEGSAPKFKKYTYARGGQTCQTWSNLKDHTL